MKRLYLLLGAFIFLGFCTTARASDTDKIYVDPKVAQATIEKHFSHMVSGYFKTSQADIDDTTVLLRVVDSYNNMLKKNDGFVSVNGVVDVCVSAFVGYYKYSKGNVADLKEKDFKDKCLAFVKDLMFGESGRNAGSNCKYDVVKVDGSQSKIKYTLPDNSGFIRSGGSIAWRFFNPGNLRGSDLQCTTIRTSPNGSFAVFPDAETGEKALYNLLSSNPSYRNLTVKNAIYKYAPPSQNNTKGYVNKLKNSGINVDAKLSDLTEEELRHLQEMIMTIEGWKVAGTETFFNN